MAETPEAPVWVTQTTAQALRLRCRVQPRSSRNAVDGVLGDALKVALTAPPVDGKANAALEAFLAEFFGVARRQVRVASGMTGRNKIIEISGLTLVDAVSRVDNR